MRGKFVADGSGELHSGGISVAGGCVVEWGAAGAGKKERRQEKSDATLFCMKNPIIGKHPAAAYDSIASAGVRTNGLICAKEERAAPNPDCSGFW